ncbi:MAG: ABC transporter substrate-binding protein [Desertifilum sp. SIO1I2]|nr:ABC transporter substrate-binding protein [Desertifilum sp. SIO1I2]
MKRLSWISGVKRRWLWVAILGLATLMLSSCSPANFRTQAAQVDQVVQSSLSDPKTFNTALSQEANDLFGYIYEGLVTLNGLSGEIEPLQAESWEISDDRLTIVMKLREGLRWSDGEPLDADDVVFTYNEIYLNPDIPAAARDLLRIGQSRTLPTVRKLDNLRVEFRTTEPFAPLLRYTGLEILPEHILRPTIENNDSVGNPLFLSTWGSGTPPSEIIGNGPYRFVYYGTNERMIVDRNPYYWRKDEQGKPQPYIERVVTQIVESTDTSFLQFRSGGLDVLGVQPDFYSLLKREEQRNDFTIYTGGPTLSSSFISFNLNKGSRDGQPLIDPIKSRWFNNLAFRQAVAYAIDRRTMTNNIFRGLGEPQHSPFPIQGPYYLSPEQGLKVYDYNPERARELLLGAEFQYNDQGQLLDADGNRVRFTLITNAGNKIREAMGVQIRQDLSRIGIQVDFQPLAFNTLIERLNRTLDWECHLLGFSGGGVEPTGSINIWLPEGALHTFNQQPGPGQPPIQGWEVADWERRLGDYIIQGSQEFDEDKRREIYGQMQQEIAEYVPFIYLINPLAMAAVRDRIQGVQYSALGGAFWNLHELRIEE